jgi:hypothetical protein
MQWLAVTGSESLCMFSAPRWWLEISYKGIMYMKETSKSYKQSFPHLKYIFQHVTE